MFIDNGKKNRRMIGMFSIKKKKGKGCDVGWLEWIRYMIFAWM